MSLNSVKVYQKIIFIFVIVYVKTSNGITRPQLDLPPLPVLPSANLEILPNSYAGVHPNDRANFDEDRSQRYGPPYPDYNEDDDRDVDYRQRNRYNDNSDRTRYADRDRNAYNVSDYNRYYLNRDRTILSPQQGYDQRNPHSNDGQHPPNYYGNQGSDRNYYGNQGFNGDRDRDRFRYDQERRSSVETEKVRSFLAETDHKSSAECNQNVVSQWNFETDVNEITQAEALLAQQRYSDYQRNLWEDIGRIDQSNIFDANIFRQLKLLSTVGTSALPPDQLDRYNRLINDMLAIYNGASVCEFEQPFQCGLRLQPDLKEIMSKSRDWNELQHVWTEWRRKTGKPMRDLYGQLIDLMNEIAYSNNYTSIDDYWFSGYESLNFQQDVEAAWQEIEPLYELIHAYVRRKLREYYGPDKINRNAPLPAHILGNMYGQTWTNILDIIIPYPGRSFIDVTPTMREQGYTPLIMFQVAEEFFLSMNMSAMAPEFWINSIIERPLDRPIQCQPSAWDFCTRHDFRIKMCTDVSHKDFVSVHHEMAHMQYFLNYRHQPKVFRDGANPAFHEAISDAIALSVSTPKHLQTLGLIQKSLDDSTYDINFLFAMATDKVVFLPFALALEAWRSDVFNRRVSSNQYNCHYWILREQYGGIKPPVLRSEMDFDPGAKYHVPANIPYMKSYEFMQNVKLENFKGNLSKT